MQCKRRYSLIIKSSKKVEGLANFFGSMQPQNLTYLIYLEVMPRDITPNFGQVTQHTTDPAAITCTGLAIFGGGRGCVKFVGTVPQNFRQALLHVIRLFQRKHPLALFTIAINAREL